MILKRRDLVAGAIAALGGTLAAAAVRAKPASATPVSPEVVGAMVGRALQASFAEREALAPTGKLRVAVWLGNPTSIVKQAGAEARGIAVEIGREFAARLGVPYELVEFSTHPAMHEALRTGSVDFALTRKTPERAANADYTAPIFRVEIGYLVAPGRKDILNMDDVDKPGVRVGATAGSNSLLVLSKEFRHATLVTVPTIGDGPRMLENGEIDVYATAKPALFAMADALRNARVLQGSWDVEEYSIAIPKGRERGSPFVERFFQNPALPEMIRQAAARAGIRGIAR